jgi:hypothetical protein
MNLERRARPKRYVVPGVFTCAPSNGQDARITEKTLIVFENRDRLLRC